MAAAFHEDASHNCSFGFSVGCVPAVSVHETARFFTIKSKIGFNSSSGKCSVVV